MKQYLDKKSFSKAVKMKRVIDLDLGVRGAAMKIGISAATVSRIENGAVIDMGSFIKTCNWLNVSVCEFIKTKK